MSEGLDRRIADLQAETQAAHEALMAIPRGALPHLERALEDIVEEKQEILDKLYLERDAEWGKNDDGRMRDIANGYNGSEL